ncbi:efflux RND transporter periplasmic adaptor subunit [Vibrio splendidus]|uniref:efflux RND transporter periplasmic adaptor subunit n=1 Tax=Vibrio splendidus TaxID=29497 RepID=UPI003D134D72
MRNVKKIISLAIPCLTIFLIGCEDKSTMVDEQVRPVRITEASEAPQGLERRFSGTTASTSTAELSFRVSGRIDQFPAKVGTNLNIGGVIAKLDDSDLKLNLEQSKAQLAEAKAVLTASESHYIRLSDLHARQAVSAMDFDVVKAKFESAQAQVAQAERVVDLNQQQVSYSTLIVPTEGCSLSSTYASVNENISIGQKIATLYCGATMEITSIIPETVANTVRIGQEVEALVKTANGQMSPATITEIGLSSTTSGLYFVTAQLHGTQENIRPGMAAELFINKQFNIVEGNVWVPMVAVNEDQGQRYVMVFDLNENEQGVVRKVPIDVARFAQGYFEITNGLTKGDRVITAGLSQIYDGLHVKLLSGDVE